MSLVQDWPSLWALLISITCHWPSWGTLKVLARSPNPPVDAYLRSPCSSRGWSGPGWLHRRRASWRSR